MRHYLVLMLIAVVVAWCVLALRIDHVAAPGKTLAVLWNKANATTCPAPVPRERVYRTTGTYRPAPASLPYARLTICEDCHQ